jgi:hypothetical protein
MTMRASSPLLWLSLVASTGLAPTASAETTGRWEQTYHVHNRPSVEIDTNDGEVVVRTWDRPAVTVQVSTVGWRIGPGGVEVNGAQGGDEVHVMARTPHWEFMFFPRHRTLRIEVWAPEAADLDLKTGDGDVTVPAMRGRVAVRTGDGSIAVAGARGELRLWTGDGRIVGRSLDGTLDAHSGDGSMSVEGRFDGLTLGSGDGSITAEVMPGSRFAVGASVSTGDGRLTLRVPADLKADLDAHTGDGAIDVDLPLTVAGRVSRNHVHGSLNGGGPLVRLSSGDGSIRVEAR